MTVDSTRKTWRNISKTTYFKKCTKVRGGISRQKSNTYPVGFESCERARLERERENEREEFFQKWKQTRGRYFPFLHKRRLRNYEERLDDINPRLDSLSFRGKGEFQPRTISGLLGGS